MIFAFENDLYISSADTLTPIISESGKINAVTIGEKSFSGPGTTAFSAALDSYGEFVVTGFTSSAPDFSVAETQTAYVADSAIGSVVNSGIVDFNGKITVSGSLSGDGTYIVNQNTGFNGVDFSNVSITVDGAIYNGEAVTIASGVSKFGEYSILNKGDNNLILELDNEQNLILKQNLVNTEISGDNSGDVYAGTGKGADLIVSIGSEASVNKVYSGSAAGVDGKITTEMAGGKIGGTLYGGGKVSAAGTDLSVSGGSIGSTVYGGILAEDGETSVGSAKLTLSESALVIGYIVAGSRVNGGTHSIGSVELNLAGGDFDRGSVAYSWGAGYVTGGILDVESVNVNMSGSVDGDVFGGAHSRGTGSATVDKSIITVSGSEEYKRIYGGGWAQNGASSNVENVEINIDGGNIFAVYAGGANAKESSSTIGSAEINIESGCVENVYLTGRHSQSSVSGDVTLNFNGGDIDLISGITPWGGDLVAGTTKAILNANLEDLYIDGLDVLAIAHNVTAGMIEDIDSSDFKTLEFIIADAENFGDSWTALTTTGMVDADIDAIASTAKFFNGSGVEISGFDAAVSEDRKSIIVSKR